MRADRASFRYFKGFGLVNTREMFENASRNRYAIPGNKFYNLKQLRGIAYGCMDTNSRPRAYH